MKIANSMSSAHVLFFLLVVSFFLVLAISFFVYTNGYFIQTCNCKTSTSLFNSSKDVLNISKPDFRLLIGIHTKPEFYERRQLVRNAYALQANLVKKAEIDVRFILCNLADDEQRVLVPMEIMLYNDIIILNCTEDIEKGKTYAYFSSLPRILANSSDDHYKPYDYVIKTDDDTYFRHDNLSDTLRSSPRNDLYLGFLTPGCTDNADLYYMSGMGYVLSWDIVEWIATSDIPKNNQDGVEDVMTGIWMREGNKGKNRIDMNPRMYDFMEEPALCFRHDFVPDTVAVHKLKTNYKWAMTLKYFNVTQGLKRSILYTLD